MRPAHRNRASTPRLAELLQGIVDATRSLAIVIGTVWRNRPCSSPLALGILAFRQRSGLVVAIAASPQRPPIVAAIWTT